MVDYKNSISILDLKNSESWLLLLCLHSQLFINCMLFSDWNMTWEIVTCTHMNSYVWGKMVITMSTKAKIRFYTGAKDCTVWRQSCLCSWGSWLVGREQKGYSGQCALGQAHQGHQNQFHGFSKNLECSSLTIPAFSEPWQWKSWETHPLSMAQKLPCNFQSQYVGRKLHLMCLLLHMSSEGSGIRH